MSKGHSNPVERALADICMISERPTTHTARKLTLEPGEFLYMLAAFCFDSSRRMNYLFKATREFAPKASQALAREVLKDNETINAPGLTWKQRAEEAERIMLRLADEIGKEHDRALRDAAK